MRIDSKREQICAGTQRFCIGDEDEDEQAQVLLHMTEELCNCYVYNENIAISCMSMLWLP